MYKCAFAEVRFLDMMTQCFPDNLALISSAYELPYCFCSMVGFEMGGLMYEMFGFWAPLNLTSKFIKNLARKGSREVGRYARRQAVYTILFKLS